LPPGSVYWRLAGGLNAVPSIAEAGICPSSLDVAYPPADPLAKTNGVVTEAVPPLTCDVP